MIEAATMSDLQVLARTSWSNGLACKSLNFVLKFSAALQKQLPTQFIFLSTQLVICANSNDTQLAPRPPIE
ncbi:hypothetical protein HNQ36_000341 [Afipia massiliensis]|uniref:Uncharacterized protein n=1 Tax=Afipia massiliensis TaxID=211460 RepID=A0A840MQX7_9BRAD|nr:hypothetical protein [Afipia massiliensis]MBB5050393.1 hypothetical protein [Afipia massiliensis]